MVTCEGNDAFNIKVYININWIRVWILSVHTSVVHRKVKCPMKVKFLRVFLVQRI
jgi:hypothetical protein